jgi:uncharacterized phage protein gp47/JayE
MAGLTSDGFEILTYQDAVTKVSTNVNNALGASVDTSAGAALGILIRIFCSCIADLWQLGQACYNALDRDSAVGVQLDNLAALTGSYRPAATASSVTGTLTGVPTTDVPALSRGKTTSTLVKFYTIADATIVAVPAWLPTHAYTVGQRVTNVTNVYQCTIAGTSAGSGGPNASSGTQVDNTVTWLFLGQGTGAVDAAMSAVDAGPLIAVAGDLNKIDTPFLGWQSIINVLDATPGTNDMTDQDFRVLIDAEIAAPGTSPQDAIRADILKLPGVTSCTVFVNDLETTNADGMPPHSVEALVQGGANQAIWNQLLASVAAGIQTCTTQTGGFAVTGTATDSEGNAIPESFSRPTLEDIYVVLSLSYDAELYPADGDSEVKLAIVTYGDAQKTGKDATRSGTMAQAFSIAGVDDVPPDGTLIFTDVIGTPVAWAPTTGYVATVGSRSVVTNDGGRAYICVVGGTSAGSGGPTGTGQAIVDGGVTWWYLGNTIAISSRQLAVFDTSRITVTSTPATP